ncbi:MAG: glycosyltransferase family 4 protein, partial [Undibacterium sp.]|nr:glycosyltransferase family 4 protein [Undibacterium sp.]
TDVDSLKFLSDGLWRKLPRMDSTSHRLGNTSSLASRLRYSLGQIPLVSRGYAMLMPRLASRQLNQMQDTVFHGPNFFVPETNLPTVVTIHDLSAYYPSIWHPATRIERMQKVIPEALKRASVVVTVSEAIKQEVIKEFGFPDAKIKVILHGVDAQYHPRSHAELRAQLAHFGLTPNAYSLFVSTVEPRKNLLNLLAAYRQLPPATRQRWPLVIAGAAGWNSDEIHAQILTASSEGWLHYLGFVGQEYLPLLYAGCRLFTYPSLYEGFGLPILEAMASGVPVLTSNCSSMPEVAAGCALLVEPKDIPQMKQAIERGLEDEAWRVQAQKNGLQRAAQLTWDACVTNTVEAYKMAQRVGTCL